MSKCGICGGKISNTLVPHGAICDDNKKSSSVKYAPEIDDIQRQNEEDNAND